jgi:hypothetical protein
MEIIFNKKEFEIFALRYYNYIFVFKRRFKIDYIWENLSFIIFETSKKINKNLNSEVLAKTSKLSCF